MIPGQRIAIHNDYLGGHESHRLTIQFNRGLRDRDGGLFVLFNSDDPKDIHRIIRPVAGSGLGFEIGENSNHAVSRLHHGVRYTLVFSFHAQPGDDPLSDVVRTAFSQSKDIWFPETAKHLSDFAWQDAARLAFTPENYGTHRWLQGDSSLERLQLARLDFGNALSCLIERLPQQSRSLYEKSGLDFSDHFPADAIQQAVNLISSRSEP